MSLTPMIIVDDVPAASAWIQQVFSFKSAHGGPDFDMLEDASGRVVLWIHVRETDHEHPHLDLENMDGVGKGVTFNILVEDIEAVRKRAGEAGGQILEELHANPLAKHLEFSIAGPHGYCFTAHTAFGTAPMD